jgi:solute carrier family 50 protein (sugar transporter)
MPLLTRPLPLQLQPRCLCVQIPNGCGSFLGLVQLILYFIYRKNKGPAAPPGKGEAAAAADVEDAKKVAAAVELADATTNKAAADTVVGDSKVVASQV